MFKWIIPICLLIVAVFIATNVYAVVRCVPDGRGGMCCWDTQIDGPWKPITC